MRAWFTFIMVTLQYVLNLKIQLKIQYFKLILIRFQPI